MSYALPVYEYRTPPEITGKCSFEYPVVIAGAGLAGLTAALELGARGVRTVLLDEDNTVGAQGLSSRGICYAKRTLEILDRFGVAARICAKGVTWNEGDVFARGERIYSFNLQPEGDQKFPAFVNLQQFYVEQYLVEKLRDFPSVEVRWKNKVVGVTQESDGVTVEVETPQGLYKSKSKYLLGADGAHSRVRECVGARDLESALYDNHWCIADVKMPGSAGAVRKAYLEAPENEGGAIWYHQMADGVWRTDWLISHYADPQAEATPERARERLRKLLGPDTPFEIVWVGPWRFRRRVLEKMTHGRVFFLGDACAQHSPFGARGGNRAVQDANNLAWKLAAVLDGRAQPRLLESYELERHPAAREAVEIASRSAVFIAPETPGQRLVRDAFVDLARRHEWARQMVNVGRLSVASCYAQSPLNLERGTFDAALARPGAAAPDGRAGESFFVDQLSGDFRVVHFGKDVVEKNLLDRYGAPATYVFRPDGHVLARCTGIDEAFAREAIARALRGGGDAGSTRPGPAQPAADLLFDRLSEELDRLPEAKRPAALGHVIAKILEQQGKLEQFGV